MTIRIVTGTDSTFFVDGGSEITYLGNTSFESNTSFNYRGFRVNPASTGDLIVKLVKSSGVDNIEVFQEDSYTAGNAPSGYLKFFNVGKAGKEKGAVAVTVTDASKDYVVLLELSPESGTNYVCEVDVP
jgi:hypothetical protein